MTGGLWLEVVLMALRYLAPVFVGVFARYLTETDQARLIEILTSKEVAASIAASLVALGFGVKVWLTKTRHALTAAATDGGLTLQEIAEVAKHQSPPLSTPVTATPKLTAPK